jgi:hypothetical protein
MTIYSKEMKITRRRVEDAMKENREDRILLGGVFNGRIGERGARNWEEERANGKRKSRNKVKNAEGKRLMEWIEGNGWEVLNGNKQGDEGEWTYIGSREERDGLQNSERRSMGKSRRIQNKIESKVKPSRNSFEEAKGKNREGKG